MGVAQGDRYSPPQPIGAGRLVDKRWPPDELFRSAGTGVGGGVIDRLGATDPQVVSSAITNGHISWDANVDGQGWSGASVGGDIPNSPNGAKLMFQAMVANLNLGLTHRGTPAVLSGIDQLNAYRFIAEMAFFNTAPLGANVDLGPELCTAGGGTFDDGGICLRGTPGIGFKYSDTNVINAVSRGVQAGTLTLTPLAVPVGYDGRDLHAYELRILGAVGGTKAQAKWYIDGRLVLSRFWGGAITLPSVNGNIAGFKMFLETNGGNQCGFACKNVFWHGAADEANLL